MNKEPKVLLVGGGGIAHRHIQALVDIGGYQLFLCEPDPAKRDAISKEYGVIALEESFEEIDLRVYDFAVVSTPAFLHVDMARICIENELPLLLEKPLALKLDGIDELIQLRKEKDIFVRVGYTRRSSPNLNYLIEQLKSGLIGDVLQLNAIFCHDKMKYRPDALQTYYAKREMGGGLIMDGVTHLIDLIIWALGPIRETIAFCDNMSIKGLDCEDTSSMMFRFLNSNVIGQACANDFQKPYEQMVEFIGKNGNLRYFSAEDRIEICKEDEAWKEITNGSVEIKQFSEVYKLQMEAFIAGMKGKKCSMTTLEEAKHSLEVCLAILESSNQRRIIEIG